MKQKTNNLKKGKTGRIESPMEEVHRKFMETTLIDAKVRRAIEPYLKHMIREEKRMFEYAFFEGSKKIDESLTLNPSELFSAYLSLPFNRPDKKAKKMYDSFKSNVSDVATSVMLSSTHKRRMKNCCFIVIDEIKEILDCLKLNEFTFVNEYLEELKHKIIKI